MTTWDRQDRPLAKEFQKIPEGRRPARSHRRLEPAPADIGIVIPDEWAKPHGDYSHLA